MLISIRSKSATSCSSTLESGLNVSPSNTKCTCLSRGIFRALRKALTMREIRVLGLTLILNSSKSGLFKVILMKLVVSSWSSFSWLDSSSAVRLSRDAKRSSVTASTCICNPESRSSPGVQSESVELPMSRLLQVVTSKSLLPFHVRNTREVIPASKSWRLHHAKRTSLNRCDILRWTTNGFVFLISDVINILTTASGCEEELVSMALCCETSAWTWRDWVSLCGSLQSSSELAS